MTPYHDPLLIRKFYIHTTLCGDFDLWVCKAAVRAFPDLVRFSSWPLFCPYNSTLFKQDLPAGSIRFHMQRAQPHKMAPSSQTQRPVASLGPNPLTSWLVPLVSHPQVIWVLSKRHLINITKDNFINLIT